MRIFTTRRDGTTDPESLWRTLLGRRGAAGGTAERIRALNPHIDFTRPLAAGTMLFVPDIGDVKEDAGTAAGDDAAGDMLRDLDGGFKALRQRSRSGVAEREAEHAEIASALKSAPSRRIVDADPVLRKQLEAAAAQFKSDQKRAKEAQSQIEKMHAGAMEEFGRLRKLLAG